ncbi:phosphate signaling complex protein PhoU [Halochromatium roseum]|uniref:phosphate signaling complex protein PhoU n=1 Tax=Halochromatium roseum TaxID=391920 RepID=UPI001911DD5F|nr:phosphate signaling complex protein PhoU [Halochromatium roseum]MBK5940723.1 phosphate transport system regulatory protein PhoU [Halochromatium roseum]
MQTPDDHQHIVSAYDLELAHLRSLVVDMVSAVARQTRDAVEALATNSSALAREIVDRDPDVDALSLAADEEVFRVIAKRQPTAIDLRLVLATARIVGELERAGDKAKRIAKHCLKLIDTETRPLLPELAIEPMQRLMDIDCELLQDAVSGLVEADLQKAVAVFQADSRLIAASEQVRISLFDPATKLSGDHFASLLTVAHALERTGNHANNIAEQVVYVITGEDVRFRNRELLIDRLRSRAPASSNR